jgi:hypothetical protein
MTEILHYFGLACLIASLLMRVLPAPSEIGWPAYAVFYGIVRRTSLNLPSIPAAAGVSDPQRAEASGKNLDKG